MDNLEIVKEIIKEQSLIIGEYLARNRAEKTGAVSFNSSRIEDISVKREVPETIEMLIKSYEEVFGRASAEVCLDVIRRHPISEVGSLLSPAVKTRL